MLPLPLQSHQISEMVQPENLNSSPHVAVWGSGSKHLCWGQASECEAQGRAAGSQGLWGKRQQTGLAPQCDERGLFAEDLTQRFQLVLQAADTRNMFVSTNETHRIYLPAPADKD